MEELIDNTPGTPAQVAAAPSLALCITCGHDCVFTYKICCTCHLILACCSDTCYSNPATHRIHTQHYRQCRKVNLTPQQFRVQPWVINKKLYDSKSPPPCRCCGDVEYNIMLVGEDKPKKEKVNCQYRCETSYCSHECEEKDRERHLTTDGECVKRIMKQLPLNTSAPSVHSSRLLPELLAHTISFLSLYQWNIAGHVNHAWRNATLQPSAFTHEVLWLVDMDTSHKIGPLHRACIRSARCNFGMTIPWKDFTHLRALVPKFYDTALLTDPDCVKKMLEELPHQLTSIELNDWSRVPISAVTVLTLKRFTRLHRLHMQLGRDNQSVSAFTQSVQQLTELNELSLTISDSQTETDQRVQVVTEQTGLTELLDAIALNLSQVKTLTLFLPVPGVSSLFHRPMPQVINLTLREMYTTATSEAHIHLRALGLLSKYFPHVAHLTLKTKIVGKILYDPSHIEQRDCIFTSIITCIHGFGSQLRSLNLPIEPNYSSRHEDDDTSEWYSEYPYRLPSEWIEKLLAKCFVLDKLNFERHAYLITDEIDAISRQTPKLKSIFVELKPLEPSDASRFMESLQVKFPHLTKLRIHWLPLDWRFAPPSAEYLARQDSLPPLHTVHLEFEHEDHIPGVLRLLPKIDALILSGMTISPERFFEYAQYRPLAFVRQNQRTDHDSVPVIQTLNENELKWFDEEAPTSVHVASIREVLPSDIQPFYDRGVALSQQADGSEVLTSSEFSSHRWMFSRVGDFTWNWCRLEMPEEGSLSGDESNGEEEVGEAVAGETRLLDHLPDAFAYHRSSVWIYTHEADVTRNDEYKSIAVRFQNFASELHLNV